MSKIGVTPRHSRAISRDSATQTPTGERTPKSHSITDEPSTASAGWGCSSWSIRRSDCAGRFGTDSRKCKTVRELLYDGQPNRPRPRRCQDGNIGGIVTSRAVLVLISIRRSSQHILAAAGDGPPSKRSSSTPLNNAFLDRMPITPSSLNAPTTHRHTDVQGNNMCCLIMGSIGPLHDKLPTNLMVSRMAWAPIDDDNDEANKEAWPLLSHTPAASSSQPRRVKDMKFSPRELSRGAVKPALELAKVTRFRSGFSASVAFGAIRHSIQGTLAMRALAA
ncbi:hypothetical protein BDN72DRAFT_863429, partial [Pluteus cervinus]